MESVYEALLAGRLMKMGYAVARQQSINIDFDGMRFDGAFKIDLMVDQRLIVEIKSIEGLLPVHSKQLLTYLRLTNQSVGLLINFGATPLRTAYADWSITTSLRPPPLREPNNLGD